MSSSTKNNDNGTGSTAGSPTVERLQSALSNMQQQQKDSWHNADLLGVVGAGTLFLGILVGPAVVTHLKKNDSDDGHYYDLDDDDVTALTRQVLEYAQARSGQQDDTPQKENKENPLVHTSSDLVARVLRADTVRHALTDLAVKVLNSEEVLKAGKVLVRQLFRDLLDDEDTTKQVVALLNKVVVDATLKQAVVDLILQLTDDQEVNRAVTKMVARLADDEEVMAATQALLTESAHKTLNDPEILDHSMEFAADVVGDDVVQRTSGEALWNTISYSFRPGFASVLSTLGVSLVLLSLYLLGPRSAPSSAFTAEDAALVSSLASIGRDVHGNSTRSLSGVVWRDVPARLGKVVVSVLTLPWRWTATAGRAVVGAVTACGAAVWRPVGRALSSIDVGGRVRGGVGVVTTAVVDGWVRLNDRTNEVGVRAQDVLVGSWLRLGRTIRDGSRSATITALLKGSWYHNTKSNID